MDKNIADMVLIVRYMEILTPLALWQESLASEDFRGVRGGTLISSSFELENKKLLWKLEGKKQRFKMVSKVIKKKNHSRPKK